MAIPAPLIPPPEQPVRGFGTRLAGALRLHAPTYEEVEADSFAIWQAIGVVVLSSVAAGIGARVGWSGVVVGVFASVFSWYVWAMLTWWIGTRLFPTPGTQATQGELLRTLGFASAPGMIQILGVVPELQRLSIAIAAIWMVAAGVVAVRQALDYRSTWRAVAVVATGWIVQWLVLLLILGFARQAT